MNGLVPLEAVRAALQAQQGYPFYLTFADVTSGQYGIVAGKPWESPAEQSVSTIDAYLDTTFTVKAVTGTVAGVGIMLSRVRDQLWPDHAPSSVPLAGWRVEVIYERSEFVAVDESKTLTDSNRHPAFGVDTYRLTAEPL